MNITVPGWVLLLLSAFTAFTIGASTPMLAVVAVLKDAPIPPRGVGDQSWLRAARDGKGRAVVPVVAAGGRDAPAGSVTVG